MLDSCDDLGNLIDLPGCPPILSVANQILEVLSKTCKAAPKYRGSARELFAAADQDVHKSQGETFGIQRIDRY